MVEYPNKEDIIRILNEGIDEDEYLWHLNNILGSNLIEEHYISDDSIHYRLVILMYISSNFYLYDLVYRNEQWEIISLVPLVNEFIKKAYSIIIVDEMKILEETIHPDSDLRLFEVIDDE